MSVSRETRIEQYLMLLERWGRTLNLTSAGERSRLRDHVDLCVSMADYLPPGLDRLIDLGSGQGFPAIPLAIQTGVRIDLIEADRRKSAFLQTVMAQLSLCGCVHPVRFEAAQIEPALCVTARALAPLSRLVALAAPFAAPGGTLLFLKGANVDTELADLPPELAQRACLIPLGQTRSHLVKFSSLG